MLSVYWFRSKEINDMGRKSSKKRIIFTLSLICLLYLILTIYLVKINMPPYSPIKHEFDSKTGIVTFKLDKEYSFDSIQLSLGFYQQPNFDSDTSEVSFCAFDLPVGKHDFVFYVAHKRDNTKQVGVEFEILHQSNNELVVQEFRNGSQFPGYRRMYMYNY